MLPTTEQNLNNLLINLGGQVGNLYNIKTAVESQTSAIYAVNSTLLHMKEFFEELMIEFRQQLKRDQEQRERDNKEYKWHTDFYLEVGTSRPVRFDDEDSARAAARQILESQPGIKIKLSCQEVQRFALEEIETVNGEPEEA